MRDNLIFLTEDELDKPIYRIFTFDHLKDLFDDKKITLVKPKKWDDPFENFILNSTGKLPDGREFQIRFRDEYYGQCWSLNRESDAMWRIYSPEKDGVKVKTTIRKLFTPIFETEKRQTRFDGTKYNISSFIGKVKYSNTKYLEEMLKDKERMSDKIFDDTGWGQASTFFFKRWAFKHEKEIRIIFHEFFDNINDYYKFDIDPFNMLDEIVFDPRMEPDSYNRKRKMIENFGYTKKINQSNLYKLKKFKLELSFS